MRSAVSAASSSLRGVLEFIADVEHRDRTTRRACPSSLARCGDGRQGAATPCHPRAPGHDDLGRPAGGESHVCPREGRWCPGVAGGTDSAGARAVGGPGRRRLPPSRRRGAGAAAAEVSQPELPSCL
jgi:hypothetical protein